MANKLFAASIFILCSTIICLAIPRIVAIYTLIPVKNELSLKTLNQGQYLILEQALNKSLNWNKNPDYYFLKERSLLRSRKYFRLKKDQEDYYKKRISLLVKGLSLAGFRPFEWSRLAHLGSMTGDTRLAKKALEMSILTGPHIKTLYFTRLITFASIWPELDDAYKDKYQDIARLAYRHFRARVVIVARKSSAVREIYRRLFRDSPVRLLAFYRLIYQSKSSG